MLKDLIKDVPKELKNLIHSPDFLIDAFMTYRFLKRKELEGYSIILKKGKIKNNIILPEGQSYIDKVK